MRSSQVPYRGVWLWFALARSNCRPAARELFARPHIEPLSLIIPIRSLVDGLHFRQRERDAAEAVRVVPLHIGSKNHFSLRRLAVSRPRAMQVDQSDRHELK